MKDGLLIDYTIMTPGKRMDRSGAAVLIEACPKCGLPGERSTIAATKKSPWRVGQWTHKKTLHGVKIGIPHWSIQSGDHCSARIEKEDRG